ncbi:hypothetical protein AYI70_g5786 [Smittium culicis]|uniref:RGS domain-containing protein n=1 Tax=Smittium culicis TaxID=133412 RepID=A0A1R1XSY8_9FUNG|nr:hypothetical protein AYI70_g5786 [Smittium culicis]
MSNFKKPSSPTNAIIPDPANKSINMSGKLNLAYSNEFFNSLESPKHLSVLERKAKEKYCPEIVSFIKSYQELKIIVLSYVVEYRKSVMNSVNIPDTADNSLPAHTQLTTRASLDSIISFDNLDSFDSKSITKSFILDIKNNNPVDELSITPDDQNFLNLNAYDGSLSTFDIDLPFNVEDHYSLYKKNINENVGYIQNPSSQKRNSTFYVSKDASNSTYESTSPLELSPNLKKLPKCPQDQINDAKNHKNPTSKSNISSNKNLPSINNSAQNQSSSTYQHNSTYPKDRSLWRDLVRSDVFVQIHALPLPSTISQSVLSSIPQRTNKNWNNNSDSDVKPQENLLELDKVAKTRVPRPLRPYFQDMYSKFFSDHSEYVLNVPGLLAQSMEDMLYSKNITYGLFDSALEVVLEMIYLNLFSSVNST